MGWFILKLAELYFVYGTGGAVSATDEGAGSIIVGIGVGPWAGTLKLSYQSNNIIGNLKNGWIVYWPIVTVALVRGSIGSAAAVVISVKCKASTFAADDLAVLDVLKLRRTDTGVVKILDTTSSALTIILT